MCALQNVDSEGRDVCHVSLHSGLAAEKWCKETFKVEAVTDCGTVLSQAAFACSVRLWGSRKENLYLLALVLEKLGVAACKGFVPELSCSSILKHLCLLILQLYVKTRKFTCAATESFFCHEMGF